MLVHCVCGYGRVRYGDNGNTIGQNSFRLVLCRRTGTPVQLRGTAADPRLEHIYAVSGKYLRSTGKKLI